MKLSPVRQSWFGTHEPWTVSPEFTMVTETKCRYTLNPDNQVIFFSVKPRAVTLAALSRHETAHDTNMLAWKITSDSKQQLGEAQRCYTTSIYPQRQKAQYKHVSLPC